MRWKQFLTPVKSIDALTAQNLIQEDHSIELLDVRQPGEYKLGHIPGSKLIPLPKLDDSYNSLPKDKTYIVYCAIGGRSRIAAQQLAGYGFDRVYNLSGGFKKWDSHSAIGEVAQGFEIFGDLTSVEHLLMIAYSLEDGLKDFYLSLKKQVSSQSTATLFDQLSRIEDLHKDRLFSEFARITGKNDRDQFEKNIQKDIMEGGLTTQEYLSMFDTDVDDPVSVISLAMSIEAQALDLYTRGSDLAQSPQNRDILKRIAEEEKMHLEQLGILLDEYVENENV
jgi:sulfur-carrier protein adenylyltransferase/sulfurtransferase